MGGEFFQCIKQRSFDHQKGRRRQGAVRGGDEGHALSLPQVGEPAAGYFLLPLLDVSYLFIPQPAYDPPRFCRIRRAYNILTRKTPIYCKKQTEPIGFI